MSNVLIASNVLPPGDPKVYAWASLRRFHNLRFVTDLICQKHSVPKSHKPNAEKQAKQIRYCLMQAREYTEAASVVSPVTRPVLLYYSAMSLALAEVLFKHDGLSSLDRARGEHKHHGLVFSVGSTHGEDLASRAESLVAKPMLVAGKRSGTFELWHRTAREAPLSGRVTRHVGSGGTVTGTNIILHPEDVRLPIPPENGFSLLDCFSYVPGMQNYLRLHHQVVGSLVRCKLRAQTTEDDQEHFLASIITQPDSQAKFEGLRGLSFEARATPYIDVMEFPNGFGVKWKRGREIPAYRGNFPRGFAEREDEVHFCSQPISLNEFGVYYVGLYICGNYARYYPDLWIKDYENSSPVALAAERFMEIAEARMPLLTTSELERVQHLSPAP